ncbi:hypothetical protein GD606_02530 [Desulfolutivibrio sulfodismutans DSM 3696]|nr:hypothetical protein GD606_02530 [Desulfolutivibrio sulfodismutans DSM 3696]
MRHPAGQQSAAITTSGAGRETGPPRPTERNAVGGRGQWKRRKTKKTTRPRPWWPIGSANSRPCWPTWSATAGRSERPSCTRTKKRACFACSPTAWSCAPTPTPTPPETWPRPTPPRAPTTWTPCA